MAIKEASFDAEEELHTWVSDNLETFLPGTKYLKGIYIRTVSGKHGKPDGFGINFRTRNWYILESELLSHGVWPHIAEQLTRYVVAAQNVETRRLIRDHIFETILEEGLEKEVCGLLETTSTRLLQELEVFVKTVEPELVVFIDDTNRDLKDMAHALSAQVKIFRVKKYEVDGVPDYHSPDQYSPSVETEASMGRGVEISEYDVLKQLGGGDIYRTEGRFKVYQLESGKRIHIKRSKFHERYNYYWYALTMMAWDNIHEYGVKEIIFVMGEEGFVCVPVDIIEEYLDHTFTSKDEEGSIQQYHLYISPGPEVTLFSNQDDTSFNLSDKYKAV